MPATFALCQKIIAPGGTTASVDGGLVDPYLDELWDRNITGTARFVAPVSTPMLLRNLKARTIAPTQLVTHRFKLDQIVEAYETFKAVARR